MGRMNFLFVIAILFIFLDIYTYYGLRSIIAHERGLKIFAVIYIGLSIMTYFFISQVFLFYSGGGKPTTPINNFMVGFIFTMLISKMVFGAMMFLQDGGRVLVGGVQYVRQLLLHDAYNINTSFVPERRQFITNTAAMVAGVPFLSMLYGITKGKYQYTVERVVLSFKDLPSAFDGFKIAQISDIHSGSFDSREKVLLGIQKINDLDADIVCFTGDLVNSEKEEIDPYVDIFAQIKAKTAKYAILGNHDYYGSYDRSNPQAEGAYFEDFFKRYDQMGFDLINNEHRKIEKDGQSINILGVENWGAGRWFPKRGDLDLASKNIGNQDFNVLLSHDPTHWQEKVLDHPKHMHLTLSGHTHGFQFGFKMPGFQWSPAQYRYRHWAGIYSEKNKYLYVNKGFGFLGFPGRIGMWPEITLIELRKAEATG